jgi:hypothetical protein
MELLIRSLPIKEKKPGNMREGAKANSALSADDQKRILDPVKAKLDNYLEKHKMLQGFILEIPSALKTNEKNGFCKLISGQIAAFGAALRLPSRRTLVLLPSGFDSALIAHRICNNLKTSALLFFEAGDSSDIIRLIKNY